MPSSREQANQIRIGAIVVDEEAGVERHGPGRIVNRDGVGVATETVVALEQGDAVTPAEEIRRGQTGNAGPDNRDVLHAVRLERPLDERPQVARDADGGEHAQPEIRGVEFPPSDPLPASSTCSSGGCCATPRPA